METKSSAELQVNAARELHALRAHYSALGITSAADAVGRAIDELAEAWRSRELHRAWIERRTLPDGSIGTVKGAARAWGVKACKACQTHYGDQGPCDEGKPLASPHRRQ